MEHKQHRTDNIIKLYKQRFTSKIENDAKTQVYEQVRLGKLRKELVDERYKQIVQVDDNNRPIYSIKPTEEEQDILKTIYEKQQELQGDFNNDMEEILCQLDACDSYEQEMAILVSYGVLRTHDLHIETFKQDFEEETKDNK